MSLSDLEKEILADGERVYTEARKLALELRKSGLLDEIQKIEEELATLLGHNKPSEPAPEPAPQPEPVDAEVVEPEPAPAPEEAPEASEEPAEAEAPTPEAESDEDEPEDDQHKS